ncbi:MAG: NAD(P)-dependent oxidoreductase [Actinomycetota bacterium]|nr:MAG: NAD(P)-dependent oxidoreductase [Actinomycetota bacterium]
MGRVEGKVAFITGAARGQGRSHALRLADEGADIIAVDLCEGLRSNVAAAATPEDLTETTRLVEKLGGRIVAMVADVRDVEALRTVVGAGVAEFGRLDIVCANAGSWTYGPAHELTEEEWQDTLDVNLTGAWNTARAVIPILIDQGEGGSIIFTSSAMGLKSAPHVGHYAAAKHGVMGLMRTLALELAPYRIRVNSVNPGSVNTDLIHNTATYELFAPDLTNPTRDQVGERFAALSALGVPWVEAEDVSNAVLFLASDESRYVTGIPIPVDAGVLVR